MKSLKNDEAAATGSSKRYERKKSVNTRVNSLINFQIGLIALLAAAYLIVEFSVAVKEPAVITSKTYTPDEPDWDPTTYVVIPNKPKIVVKNKTIKKAPPVKPKVNVQPPIIDITEPEPDTPTEPATDLSISADGPVTDEAPAKTAKKAPILPVNRPVNAVMEVPLFPGCSPSLNRIERIACLNKKMARFVQRHFDTYLANTLGDENSVQIGVVFTIDTNGNPIDVKVKAPNKSLEKEAYRVIQKLPQMIPGKNNDVPVNVTYSLPINFKLGN